MNKWRFGVLCSAVLLAGCAGAGSADMFGGDLRVVGDENGGTIPGGTTGTSRPDAAMHTITAYCGKYGKKGFITRMEMPADGGTIAFSCLQQKGVS